MGGDLQILRSSSGRLVRVGRNICRESGSLTVRANIGALVPPLGAFILLRSVIIKVCVVALGAGDARGGFS